MQSNSQQAILEQIAELFGLPVDEVVGLLQRGEEFPPLPSPDPQAAQAQALIKALRGM